MLASVNLACLLWCVATKLARGFGDDQPATVYRDYRFPTPRLANAVDVLARGQLYLGVWPGIISLLQGNPCENPHFRYGLNIPLFFSYRSRWDKCVSKMSGIFVQLQYPWL